MDANDARELMAFLKRNGANVVLHDQVVTVWANALRRFTLDQSIAASVWFLERNHPREVAPATIAAPARATPPPIHSAVSDEPVDFGPTPVCGGPTGTTTWPGAWLMAPRSLAVTVGSGVW